MGPFSWDPSHHPKGILVGTQMGIINAMLKD
mgnify:CR=1 FL=1|jgi:hypothetical protein